MKGINLAGMEGGYGGGVAGSMWNRALGPLAGQDYPVHSPKLIDYFKKKHVGIIRLLFSWERMQSDLWGPVPASGAGYADYYANFKRVVDYATSAGIAVIIEPWQANKFGGAGGAMWRGQLVGSSKVDIFAFADLWERLAAIFKSNPRVEYGLVNEPNSMSTLTWWTTAQKCVDAIRSAGATTRIYVPGNGYTGAGTWIQNGYDTAKTKRSNAFGWLNANGAGRPLFDPLNKAVAEVHLYLDPDAGGISTDIVSTTIARERLSIAVNEAADHGYTVFVGEIGFFAGNPIAAAAWADFIAYTKSKPSVVMGFAWWAGGSPGWWDDTGANGGGHFSITPTKTGAIFSGDTVNMTLIAKSFG